MISTAAGELRLGGRTFDLARRTLIMGILNVTPDSFSDGGRYAGAEKAVARALEMIGEGADIVDVGGESTRPGAAPVPVDEEIGRVVPVIERLAALTDVPISVDTTKTAVAARALAAGAVLVNDVSGLHAEPSLAAETAKHDAAIVLMHIRGTPAVMQLDPVYGDVVGEICSYLEEGIGRAVSAGISRIIVDPGIGFGKTLRHNLEILRRLGEFRRFGYPVLVGPSRKSFIGAILDLPPDDRLEGTAAAVAVSIMNGASIVRVHDVRQMCRVARVADAVARA